MMFKIKTLIVLSLLIFGFVNSTAIYAAENTKAEDQTLKIDIPVKLDQANVVFNIGHLAMMGNTPIAIAHVALLANDFKEAQTKGKIIAVFHTDAGQATLEDAAYNAFLKVKTGNPYKQLIANLIKQGVQVELCGATAKAHGWVNTDVLPGVKVNTDAMLRLTELTKAGYVQITE